MKKTTVLFAFLVLLLFASVFTPKSEAFRIGVQVGDWFKYKGRIVYWRADPGVPFPPHQYAFVLQVYNETDWIKYEVTEIKEAAHNVTFLVTNHWKNGTETQYTLEDNMDTSFTMMVIDADLGPGDMVRPSYDWGFFVWPPRYLNETIEVEYINGTPRAVKVLDWVHPPIFEGSYTRQIYWWDNETGIQVRYEVRENSTAFDQSFQPIGKYEYIATFELIDSSYDWGAVIPEYPTWPLVLLTLTVTATISVTLYKRKLLRPK